MKRLLDRRRRLAKKLPPFEEILRGSVYERSLRCGKPTCHCASGDGHPATYLSVTLAGGRTEQVSLPRDLIPIARRWVANYLAWWNAVEEISAINRQLLRARKPSASAAPPKRKHRNP
jgi:hypothetical protein